MFWESMLRLPYILRRLEVYIFRGGRGAANGGQVVLNFSRRLSRKGVGYILESKGMGAILQKKGKEMLKKSKIFEIFGKNVQNLKVF